jgi:hypothetical protein
MDVRIMRRIPWDSALQYARSTIYPMGIVCWYFLDPVSPLEEDVLGDAAG